jgi:hypothetical protein
MYEYPGEVTAFFRRVWAGILISTAFGDTDGSVSFLLL